MLTQGGGWRSEWNWVERGHRVRRSWVRNWRKRVRVKGRAGAPERRGRRLESLGTRNSLGRNPSDSSLFMTFVSSTHSPTLPAADTQGFPFDAQVSPRAFPDLAAPNPGEWP